VGLIFNNNAPKKPTNLSINSDLLQQAKALKINLSQTLEDRLTELIREARSNQWLSETRVALEEYNQHVEQSGVFNDHLRSF